MRLRQAFLLLLPLAGALVTVPARAETCAGDVGARATLESVPAPTRAAAKAALAGLESLRKNSFETLSFAGEYGFVSFLALQSREARDARLRELFSRAARDQFIRLAWNDFRLRKDWAEEVQQEMEPVLRSILLAEMCRIDADNQAWLKADIRQNGWPRKSIAGENADSAAWLLVQHAADDQPFQREVLALLGPLAEAGETGKDTYALLFDRVAYYSGRPQRYGSQGSCATPHSWSPFPIEDRAGVDKRRAEVGLPPLSEYVIENSKACP